MPTTRDHYELLGVRREASAAELKRGYELSLARANRDGAHRVMLEIVNAYEVLSHGGRRRLYDEQGVSVLPERLPNTFGRATPFRGGTPSLGQTRRAHAPARSVLPASSSRACPTDKQRLTVIAVMVGLSLVAVVGSKVLAQHTTTPPRPVAQSRVVPASAPADSTGRVHVRCSTAQSVYDFAAVRGQTVQCSNGAVPIWLAP